MTEVSGYLKTLISVALTGVFVYISLPLFGWLAQFFCKVWSGVVDSRKQDHKNNKLENEKWLEHGAVKSTIERLNSFLIDDREPRIITLEGDWGIGKTFLWHTYVKLKLSNKDKCCYISMFGKNSIQDIHKEIVKNISSTASVFEKTKILIGSSKPLGIDLTAVLNSISPKKYKRLVICFDDFERMSPNLDMSEVMGFISELKDKHKCRVVLIQNNKALVSSDLLNAEKTYKKDEDSHCSYTVSRSKNDVYHAYLEKLLDARVTYEPDVRFLIDIAKNGKLDLFDSEFFYELLSNTPDEFDVKFNLRFYQLYLYWYRRLIKSVTPEKYGDKYKTESYVNRHFMLDLFVAVLEFVKNHLNIEEFAALQEFRGWQSLHAKELRIYLEGYMKSKRVDISYIGSKYSEIAGDYSSTNQKLESDQKIRELSDNIDKCYNEYINSMKVSDEEFAEKMYSLLNEREYILDVVSLRDLSYYLKEFLTKINPYSKPDNNELEDLYKRNLKEYIERNKDHIGSYFFENDELFFNDYFKNYTKKLLSERRERFSGPAADSEDENIKKNELTAIYKKLITASGWKKQDEESLNNINYEKHIKWLKGDKEYFEATVYFMRWINNFSGNKPFVGFFEKTVRAYGVLNENPAYKLRTDNLIRYFKIN